MYTVIFGLLSVVAILVLVSTYPRERQLKFIVGNTSSMSPTLESGELILMKPFNPARDTLRRYQIVMFLAPPPFFPNEKWVMRVVGLPGEHLELATNGIRINASEIAVHALPTALRNRPWLTPRMLEGSAQRQWTLSSNEVFVVGDNLGAANDSRLWGPLDISKILGVLEKKTQGTGVALEVEQY